MSTTESIAWLEAAIAHERAVAASWSLSGWPCCANHYRRNVLKAMRILQRVREAARISTPKMTP
jgi:transposase-like protein